MKIIVNYSRQSEKFLKKNKSIITEQKVDIMIAKAIRYLAYNEIANIDLRKMKKSKDKYRIRYRNIRVIFSYIKNRFIVVEVILIDFRGNVYKRYLGQ